MFILIVSSIGMLNPATFSTAKKQISKSFLFLFTIVPDCNLKKKPVGALAERADGKIRNFFYWKEINQ